MALQPESEVDVLVGVGGTPEGIVAACATAVHGRRDVRQAGAAGRARNAGRSWTPATTRAAVLTTSDLVRGDNAYFVATGVTDGDVLRGVRYSADLAVSQPVAMRSRTGVVRLIESRHRLSTTSIVLPRV